MSNIPHYIMFDKITKKDCFAAKDSKGEQCSVILNSDGWSCEKCPFYKNEIQIAVDKAKVSIRNTLIKEEKEKANNLKKLSDQKEIAKRLRNIRKEKGLSQTDLAEMLGVTKQCISLFECGERLPKYQVIERFADALGVDVEYFINGITLKGQPITVKNKPKMNQDIYDYAEVKGVSISVLANILNTTEFYFNKFLTHELTPVYRNKVYDTIDWIVNYRAKYTE